MTNATKTLSRISTAAVVAAWVGAGARADDALRTVEIDVSTSEVTTTTAEADALLKITVAANCTNVYSGAITGASRIEKYGAGVLRLTNGGNTFTGGVTFDEGEIWAEAEGCLGTGAVRHVTGGKIRCLDFRAPNATFSNPILFDKMGSRASEKRCQIELSATTRLTGPIHAFATATDDHLSIGGKFGNDGNMKENQIYTFDGDITVEGKVRLLLVCYGTMIFNGRIDAYMFSMSQNSSSQGWLYFNNPSNNFACGSYGHGLGYKVDSYDPYVNCGAVNCISNLYWCPLYNFGGNTYNCLNLHGYDQLIQGIKFDGVDDSHVLPQAPNDANRFFVTAGESPATLTLIGTGADQTTITQHALNGPLSVVVDAAPTYTLVLSNRTHTMTGTFTVSNGTVKAYQSTTFRNAAGFAVADGAAFELETDQANAFQSCNAITVGKNGAFRFTDANASLQQAMGIHLAVTLDEGAKLALPAGKKLICKSLATNGVALAEGTYTSAEIEGLESGTLRVTDQYWPEETEPVYTVTVAAGATNRLDDLTLSVRSGGVTTEKAMSACTAADFTTGTLVKKGEGLVISSTKLSQFVGQILIEGGAFLVDDNLQTGPQNATTTAAIWTKRGASFGFIGTKDTCGAYNLKLYNTFHFAGTGLYGQGVVLNLLAVQQPYVFNWKSKWYVDEDILLKNIPGFTQRWDWAGPEVAYQGNTITCERCAQAGWTFYVNAYAGTLSAGKIVLRGVSFHPEGGPSSTLGTETPVVLEKNAAGNNASVSYYNSNIQMLDYHIKVAAGERANWSVSGSDKEASWMAFTGENNSYWQGPITVNGAVNAYSAVSHRGLMLKGKFSGNGEFTMKNGLFKLYSGDNDYTGSIAVWSEDVGNTKADANWAALMVWRNGALPVGCRSVAVTNAPVYLVGSGTYDLPAIRMMVPSVTNLAFYGQATGGTLAGLVKEGAGRLDYEVPLAITGRLEVAEGTFKPKSGAVTVGTLAMGGGTVDGDVTVTEGLAYSGAAVAVGQAAKTTITGTLAFGSGAAAFDFDALVADAALKGRSHTIAEAAGGVTGLVRVQPPVDSPAYAAGWYVESDGSSVYLKRWASGNAVLIR